MITAAIIGIGMFVLFVDLPRSMQDPMLKHSWIPHIIVFFLLFMLHGGTGEGATMAGIATVIFRWFTHTLAKRRFRKYAQPQAAVTSGYDVYEEDDVKVWLTAIAYIIAATALGIVYIGLSA